MQLFVTVLVCILGIDDVYGTQSLQYTTRHVGTKVEIDVRILLGDDPVTVAVIPNTNTGQLQQGTSQNACQYDENTSPVPLVRGETILKKAYLDFSVVIDYTATPTFETTGGTDLGCFFTIVNAATREFRFHVRGIATLSTTTATDREYLIQTSSSDDTAVNVEGSTTFLGPATLTQTAVPVTTYAFAMTVVDSPAHADQTSLDLGTTFQLKYVMTVNPYESKMDLSGARITNCVVDKTAAFNTPAVNFIGIDGCYDKVDIFSNVNTNVGFSRDASSGISGNIKTYIAYSPKLEMSAFSKNPVNVPNALFFKCDITLCLIDTDSTTAGQCGASSCDPARKKRDIHEIPDASVIASVNITTKSARKGCSKCSETAAFQASVGGLATVAALVFGLMTLSFTGARNAAIYRLQKHRKAKTGSFYSTHSDVSLSSRSVKGSDVTSNGSSMTSKSHA